MNLNLSRWPGGRTGFVNVDSVGSPYQRELPPSSGSLSEWQRMLDPITGQSTMLADYSSSTESQQA